jgi:membrane-bound lytic murein transglycosylase A
MLLVAAAALAVAGCEVLAPQARPPVATTAPPPPVVAPPVKPPATVAPGRPRSAIDAAALRPAGWSDLPGWRSDDPAAAWSAFLASCRALAQQDLWRETCGAAQAMSSIGRDTARQFFETNLRPFQVVNPEGSAAEGLVTGYYEPLVRGSRKPSARYRYPVFGVPDDLLIVDLAEAYPELKGLSLRGRLEGRRIVPYYDRAGIEGGSAALAGREIAWVDDPVELFFLQVQGSGRIALDTGETMRVGYAEHNGYPYRSIGRLLVERGELTLEKASMQGI